MSVLCSVTLLELHERAAYIVGRNLRTMNFDSGPWIHQDDIRDTLAVVPWQETNMYSTVKMMRDG
jgi:hypothetical protein